MVFKTAAEILEEMVEARKHMESMTIVLDGAEAHFIIESMADSLQKIALSFIEINNTNDSSWNDPEYGSRSEAIEVARELGLTAVSAMKTFVGSLPDEINSFKVQLEPLDTIAKMFG
jgi:hypothetical protein